MSSQRIMHGSTIETTTPGEIAALLAPLLPAQQTRIRAPMNVLLDANGAGQDEVYKVPLGAIFQVRRITLDLDKATDPSTGNVPLNVAGKFVAYLRSGRRIEYAAPSSPNAVPQVPGVQTWGAEQGPTLRNGEVFEIQAAGLTAGAILYVTVEGFLIEPGAGQDL